MRLCVILVGQAHKCVIPGGQDHMGVYKCPSEFRHISRGCCLVLGECAPPTPGKSTTVTNTQYIKKAVNKL